MDRSCKSPSLIRYNPFWSWKEQHNRRSQKKNIHSLHLLAYDSSNFFVSPPTDQRPLLFGLRLNTGSNQLRVALKALSYLKNKSSTTSSQPLFKLPKFRWLFFLFCSVICMTITTTMTDREAEREDKKKQTRCLWLIICLQSCTLLFNVAN